METLMLDNRELPYAIKEEMKVLRTNLMFCGDEKRVILVTSVVSDEGKSHSVMNLCRSFAELGKTVLMLDCDLRKSVLLDSIPNSKGTRGLSHFLSGQCAPEDILYWSGIDGMYVIPAGAFPPNPSELLASKRMEQLITALRGQFDYIFLDAAPLGMVIDAAGIAPYCDGTVLLVESGRVPYRLAQNVLTSLKNTGTPVLGAVLNKVGQKNSNIYYKRAYRGYYRGYYKGAYKGYYKGYYK